jgi:4-amino-4-deoxy-L-arabinose transferase-like glycosyltransferase
MFIAIHPTHPSVNPLVRFADSTLASTIGRWMTKGRRAEWILILVCLTLYLPGFFSMPAIDRDEARFVQASRQMLDAASWHDLIIPMIQDRPRLQKPPLIYWLQSASAWCVSGRLFGSSYAIADVVWMYRLPSLFAAIVVSVMTMRLARRMYAPPAAILAGFLIACNPVMFWEARQGRSDMVMLAFIILAIDSLWRVLERRSISPSRRDVVLLWLMVSLGVLTKGPVPLMVVLLGLLVLSAMERTADVWRRVRPGIGVIIVSLPISIWVWMLSKEIDLPVYLSRVWQETGGRAAVAMEGHGGPAGYHVVVMYAAFFPACMLAIPAVIRSFKRAFNTTGRGWTMVRNLHARHRTEAFLLSLVVPSWIVFETSGTKLPHYTLPLYPLLAIMSARMVFAASRLQLLHKPILAVLLRFYAIFCGVLPIVALSVAGYMLVGAGEHTEAAGMLGIGVVVGVMCAGACLKFVTNQRYLAAQCCGLMALFCAAAPLGYCAGKWPDMRLSHRVAEVIESHDPSGTRPVATVSFHEDSMIFETRGRAQRVNEWQLKAWLVKNPDAIVVLDAKRAASWSRFAVIGNVAGLNYSNGKMKDLVIGEFIEQEVVEGNR